MNNNNAIVLSNIIGLNPTGTLDFNGTYSMNGNNDIIQNQTTASKESLDKAQNNQIICNNVEKFENYNNLNNDILIYSNFNKKIIILIIFIFILLIILFLI